MKKGIHPENYRPVVFKDMSNGDMVLDRYEKVLKPMHEQFIEPTKKFADLIVPWGGDNRTGIHILKTYIQGIVTGV